MKEVNTSDIIGKNRRKTYINRDTVVHTYGSFVDQLQMLMVRCAALKPYVIIIYTRFRNRGVQYDSNKRIPHAAVYKSSGK